jgi:hypothetical protein
MIFSTDFKNVDRGSKDQGKKPVLPLRNLFGTLTIEPPLKRSSVFPPDKLSFNDSKSSKKKDEANQTISPHHGFTFTIV